MGLEAPVIGALVGGGLGLIGAGKQASAARSAADLQYRATQDQMRQQREMFDILNEQQRPYRESGYAALTRLGEMLPQLTTPISAAEISAMPGYQFAVQQGTGAARQMANVGGGGSNVDRAAQKFAIDYTLANAVPFAQQQRTNIYNTLAGVAGIGQTAQGQTQQLGMNTANALSQLGLGGASALGAGQVGAANAYASALGGLGSNLTLATLLGRV